MAFGIDDAIGGIANLGSTLLGGILGNNAEKKKREEAERIYKEYLAKANKQMALNPQEALAFLGLNKRSAFEDTDPVSKQMAMSATRNLLERGSGSGLDIQSKQALQEAAANAGQRARAARQGILQEFMQRGNAGGGAELAAQLGNAQQSYSDLASAQGQAAAAAEQRRLEANVLAARSSQQQQAIDQAKAQAIDALRKFNVGAKQQTIANEMGAMNNLGSMYQGWAGQVTGNAGANNRNISNIGQGIGGLFGLAGGVYGAGKNNGWWGGGGNDWNIPGQQDVSYNAQSPMFGPPEAPGSNYQMPSQQSWAKDNEDERPW